MKKKNIVLHQGLFMSWKTWKSMEFTIYCDEYGSWRLKISNKFSKWNKLRHRVTLIIILYITLKSYTY